MNAFHLLEYFLLMYSLVTIGLFDSSHTVLFSFWKRNFTRKYPAEILFRCTHIEPGLVLTFSFFFSTSCFCLWLSPASLLPPGSSQGWKTTYCQLWCESQKRIMRSSELFLSLQTRKIFFQPCRLPCLLISSSSSSLCLLTDMQHPIASLWIFWS